MATKAQRHKVKLFVKIYLCVLVPWWRKCFAIKCKKIAIKVLKTKNGLTPVSSISGRPLTFVR
jgi:hypothetical protein